jgi:transposase InsO family protein
VPEAMQNLCERVGTERILTIPYAPQTDGMVERFIATLCWDLAMFVTHKECTLLDSGQL